MAIGFPSYEQDTAKFRGRSREELLAAAEQALDDLGWEWDREGRRRLVASTPAGFVFAFFYSWGDQVTVEADDDEVRVRSQGGSALAWLDFGQHRANINKFLERLKEFLGAAP